MNFSADDEGQNVVLLEKQNDIFPSVICVGRSANDENRHLHRHLFV